MLFVLLCVAWFRFVLHGVYHASWALICSLARQYVLVLFYFCCRVRFRFKQTKYRNCFYLIDRVFVRLIGFGLGRHAMEADNATETNMQIDFLSRLSSVRRFAGVV